MNKIIIKLINSWFEIAEIDSEFCPSQRQLGKSTSLENSSKAIVNSEEENLEWNEAISLK